MSADVAGFLYLVAGVLFILALRGLSGPETSRRGNLFGMVGMAIAVATTLASHPPAGTGAWVLVLLGLASGGGGTRLAACCGGAGGVSGGVSLGAAVDGAVVAAGTFEASVGPTTGSVGAACMTS